VIKACILFVLVLESTVKILFVLVLDTTEKLPCGSATA